MSDQTQNGPINIPIESDDDFENDPAPLEDDDDVIEIDGDSVDLDADLAEIENASAQMYEPAGAATAADADFDEPAALPSKPPEISREAVFELMNELRQKSDQVVRLTEDKNDLLDRLLRKQAEFENFRKRGEREMQDAYQRARWDLVAELLPIVDNFDLAMQHSDTASLESIREGVQLIYRQVVDMLGRLGLQPVEAEGMPFDPEVHEAVATETSDEVPDHTVVVVLQRGFRLGDRLLRPARVKVAVQPDAD